MTFRPVTIEDLTIEDERSFRHIELYGELKRVLRRDGYRFRVPAKGETISWDRVLFLNLTFWDAVDQGDFLTGPTIAADVVAHVAWHHLARKAFPGRSAASLFLGESIASAFDLYLVGRLLGHAPDAEMLATQVPAMAEAAEAAGTSEEELEALLREVATDPERAFEDLRELLFDASSALVSCSAPEAPAVIARFDSHRMGALLHHYELSTWILYARAHADSAPDAAVLAFDEELRNAPGALDLLEKRWLAVPD